MLLFTLGNYTINRLSKAVFTLRAKGLIIMAATPPLLSNSNESDELNLLAAQGESSSASLLLSLLGQIDQGSLQLRLANGAEFFFGRRFSTPEAKVTFHSDSAFSQILTGGSLVFGENYMNGWWDVEHDKIADLFGIVMLNNLEEKLRHSWSLWLKLGWHYLLNNPLFLKSAQDCIEFHYDLGNNFFELILDQSLAYSCGYQLHPSDTLTKMQQQKYSLICKKLGLEEGGQLIDIGCGWGGFLLYVARNYPNVRGLGITLSQEQCELAQDRIARNGFAGRFKVELCDYRNVQGHYDFLVSIGMFEHVGRRAYPLFMRRSNELLKPGGKGLLHTIGVPDRPAVRPDAWTNVYIFPGSRLPRLDEIVKEMRNFDLLIAQIDNLKPHYAETLRQWKNNFDSNRNRISALDPRKYDGRFMRMWNYYLQSCEASFRYGTTQLYQVLFTKGKQWKFPMNFGTFYS